MLYSSEAEELRAFLRDKLELRSFDIGGGWLIFDLPGAEVGCHPVDPEKGRGSGVQHVSFYCDDIKGTVAELSARGVEFTGRSPKLSGAVLPFFQGPWGLENCAVRARLRAAVLRRKTMSAITLAEKAARYCAGCVWMFPAGA